MTTWPARPPAATPTLAQAWLAGLALCATVGAAAADDAALRTQVEHKIRLADTLGADTSTLQRIAASADPQARAHLDEARVHHAVALERLASGDLAGAQQAVDDALRHIGLARRLVPDAPTRQAAARQRHEQLLASVERLLESWQSHLGTASRSDDAKDLTAALGLVADARDLGRAARFDEANRSLALAERHVLDGMNRLLHAGTLDYTPRPAGPADEFQHELARHGSLSELVPLAVKELRPGATALALIERYAETSRTLRAQAVVQLQSGEPRQALEHIRNASSYLERALAAAGLVAPPPTGTAP